MENPSLQNLATKLLPSKVIIVAILEDIRML